MNLNAEEVQMSYQNDKKILTVASYMTDSENFTYDEESKWICS